jgi:hypothetical protein
MVMGLMVWVEVMRSLPMSLLRRVGHKISLGTLTYSVKIQVYPSHSVVLKMPNLSG